MTSKFTAAYILCAKEIANMLKCSQRTAQNLIRKWKAKLGLDRSDFFTVEHLSNALKMSPDKVSESLSKANGNT